MSDVVVLVGSGFIGQAIARRVGAGKQMLLADLREENARAAAEVLADAGFDVSTTTADVSSRDDVRQLALLAADMGSASPASFTRRASHRRRRRQRPYCVSICTERRS